MFNEPTERIGQFKKGIDKDESRRKRQEVSLNNRKNRRFENLRKKRHVVNDPVDLSGMSNSDLPVIFQKILGEDDSVWQEATRLLKKLLSAQNDPPIDQVVQHPQVVARLVQFLRHRNSDLIMEAAWALTNIASGTSEDTLAVVQADGIPAFCQLLVHQREDIREQAIWALGNISGESMECRDAILNNNGLYYIIPNLETSSITIKRNTMWTISNLLRGEKPSWAKVLPAIPAICRVVDQSNDEQTLIDCLWALSYITDGKDFHIQAVLDEIDIPRLFSITLKGNTALRNPGVRTIGNIISGNDSQTLAICEAGAVQVIVELIRTTEKENLKKECIWILSNAAASTQSIVQDIIDSGVTADILYQLKHGQALIKRESLWVISNMASTGTSRQVEWLVKNGVIALVCDLLISNDSKLILTALSALKYILASGEEMAVIMNYPGNPYVDEIDRCRGITAIEELQDHDNEKIFEISSELILSYFGGVDVVEEPTEDVWGSFSSNQPSETNFNF